MQNDQPCLMILHNINKLSVEMCKSSHMDICSTIKILYNSTQNYLSSDWFCGTLYRNGLTKLVYCCS